jgi:hypothetical protein
MMMTMKRWLIPIAGAIGCVVADVIALVLVTRAFLPQKPPNWATAPFFWVLAWPVPLFSRVFPQSAGSHDHGPSFLAVAAGGLVDLIILAGIIDFVRRRRGGNAVVREGSRRAAG